MAAFEREAVINEMMVWWDEHMDRIGQRGMIRIQGGKRINVTERRRAELERLDDWRLWEQHQRWKKLHTPKLPREAIRVCYRGD